MFTGLIEELGTVVSVTSGDLGGSICIEAHHIMSDIAAGDSIAVNGVCLTAIEPTTTGFSADVSPETFERTTLGDLTAGSRVNLERAVTPQTRLGGHIVQGHVDGRGTFVRASDEGDFHTVTIQFPSELDRYFVEKGSVTIDGISLTIAKLRTNEFDIAVIPKTWELTNLSHLTPTAQVNLEVDIIAKYIERMMGLN